MRQLKFLLLPVILVTACASRKNPSTKDVSYSFNLPQPFATKSVTNFSNDIGWQANEQPVAPKGFRVSLYADGLDNPRWLYLLPNGDVLVAEANTEVSFVENIAAAAVGITKADKVNSSANRITLLRDTDGDGKPEVKQTFLSGLNKPFGMLLIHDSLYIANTDAILRFPYQKGATSITAKGELVVNLPGLGRHWTKNILTNRDSSKIFIAAGSSSNIAEKGMEQEINRASILEMNRDGSGLRVFASGLRNPVGLAWAPGTNTLWAAVNERDELGDDLVPDYLTSVKENGFYGWPWSYYGQHMDPRVKPENAGMVAKALVPDVPLGSHTASLGLIFYTGKQFPSKYRNGAFVAQHGSWNRSRLSGYRVVFVPFKNGKPSGTPQDFLTGFVVSPDGDKVRGRPTGLLQLPDGSILLTDDRSNRIWRISYGK